MSKVIKLNFSKVSPFFEIFRANEHEIAAVVDAAIKRSAEMMGKDAACLFSHLQSCEVNRKAA